MRSVLLALAGLMLASSAGATAMETVICINGIVSKGDGFAAVTGKCGEPVQKSQREEHRIEKVQGINGKEHTSVGTVTITEWDFNFGPDEFMQRLMFENGRVVGIESLGYGF